MRRPRARTFCAPATDMVDQALARATRAKRLGCTRDEVKALRLACQLREQDAALWTRLGVALMAMARIEEALECLRHALWLRERSRDEARARVMRELIARAA